MDVSRQKRKKLITTHQFRLAAGSSHEAISAEPAAHKRDIEAACCRSCLVLGSELVVVGTWS